MSELIKVLGRPVGMDILKIIPIRQGANGGI